MTTEIVIAMYRPHAGKTDQLCGLIREHVPTLRRLELATDRAPIVMQAENGTVLEIFEWATPDAARLAHEHPEVGRIWEAMGQISDLVTLDTLDEKATRFPHFSPLDLVV